MLRFLIDQNGLSQRDVAEELGSESTVSLVLSGRRPLNRDHIARLSARFHVSPAVFFPAIRVISDSEPPKPLQLTLRGFSSFKGQHIAPGSPRTSR